MEDIFMGRTALSAKLKTLTAVIIAILVIGGIGLASSKSNDSQKPNSAQSAPTAVKQETTEITYKGKQGKSALDLLKEQAEVETKSSSFGNYVTAINGNDGGGSKYWTFYVNDKESSIGAEAYITKDSDTLKWKLQ